MKPVVAIIGRPNAGKSTLFNKLSGRREAIVFGEPGVTRDLNYSDVEEGGKAFVLIDTGGFPAKTADTILKQVRERTQLAIEEADVIVLLFDGRVGPTYEDEVLVEMLRPVKKPVIYAVNKIDTKRQEEGYAEFYSLGIKSLIPVSAETGQGLNDLADEIVAKLPVWEVKEEEEERIRVAIVGRPNVGKSSILNRLIGKQRALVSDVPGTTRDPVDAPFDFDGKRYLFIDTAGIRRKSKVSLTVESFSVMEAIKTLERCDVAVLVIDGKDGVTMQDEKIAGLMEDRKRPAIIAVNKWDVVEKDAKTADYAIKTIREKLPFISYAPVLFISALTGQRVERIFRAVNEVYEKSKVKLQTRALNKFLGDALSENSPPSYRGKEVKLYYITQTGTKPPSFTVFVNHAEGVKEPYRRYLVNRLREAFGLENVPMRLHIKKRR